MKTGGALLIVIAGVLALWIVITGRLTQLQAAWNTLNGQAPDAGSGSGGSINLPGIPFAIPVPKIPASYGTSALPVPTLTL